MKTNTKNEPVYLTKRLLKRNSKKAVIEASHRAMRMAGYVVIAQDGWVIRKDKNGSIQKIKELLPKVNPKDVKLD